MRFSELLNDVSHAAAFTSGLLLVGDRDPQDVQRQLVRWTRAGKILQLRRGVYVLAPPYRMVEPHPFVLANLVEPASYVSLQSILAWRGLIPEHAFVTTSVTLRRTAMRHTELGDFMYRHVSAPAFFGFEEAEVSAAQYARVATPEKALVDMLYLEPESARVPYLEDLRLLEGGFDARLAHDLAKRLGKTRVIRALRILEESGAVAGRAA